MLLGYLFRLLGTIIVFFFEMVIRIIKGKKIPSFKEIWTSPYNNDMYFSVTSELKLKLIGAGFFAIMLLLIHFLHW